MKAEAEKALAEGDIPRALALWAGITGGHATPAELLEHAALLHRLYRSAEAAELRERLLGHADAAPGELLAAAKLLFQAGRFSGCARFTARAHGMQPDSPDIAAMHAAALERAGDKKQAEAVMLGILARHPGHARLVRMLSHIERQDERFEAARMRLEKSLVDFPSADDWRLRYELAAVLDRLGDYSGAMRELGLAKQQLEPASARLRPAWREMTRRQWELTRALTPGRLDHWKQGKKDAAEDAADPAGDVRLCLMPGFPRSGTTLLEQIVTSHSGCIGTDESGVLATQFRDPIVFGAATTEEVLEELDGYDREELAAGRAEYLRCTADLLGEEIGNRLLIEKDPLLTADLAIPLRLFPEAKVLMPLRDPRDVAISFYFTIVPGVPNSVAAATLDETCRYYAEVMRHWLLLRERVETSRWMESRYEDLLADPESQTRALAKFLGLEWRPEMAAHHRRPGGRAISTPTYDDVARPLYTRSLERWRNYEEWLGPHAHHLAPYLEAFGYR